MKLATKPFTLLLFFLSLTTSLFSQISEIDSLTAELQNHLQKDTVRVNLLNDLAFSYHKIDSNKTIAFIDESEAIAKALGFKKGEAKNLYIKGLIHSSQSNYKNANEFFSKALLLYEKVDFEKGISNCYAKMGLASYSNSDYHKSIEYYKKSVAIDQSSGRTIDTAINLKYIGFCYADLGDYEKAQEYYDYAIDLNIKYHKQLEMSSCYMNIGSLYLKKANYPMAMEYYNKALGISEKIKDTVGISKLLNNIGIIYKNYENYDKAIENYERSLKIQSKIGNRRNVSKALNNLGSIYIRKEDYKKALNYYTEALAISIETNDDLSKTRYLNNIGLVHSKLDNNSEALQYHNEAKKISKQIDYQLGLCNSYYGMTIAHMNKKKYEEALTNALQCKNLANELGALFFQRDIYELLSEIYKETADYPKALESHQQFKKLNDSLFNKENTEKIARLDADYKYKRALDSASIRELQLTKTVTATNLNLEKTQRNYLWAVIGVLLVSMLLGSIIFYQKFNNIKAKNENIVMEQKLLRSQMTPHFIFNSLSVLQGMILNKEDKKSVSYLSRFSKLLRITLENSRDKTVLLSEEMAAVEDYLDLQNLENEAYEYTVNVEDTIDTTSLKIPPMLIQPFIENAVEHAFVQQKESRKIAVHLKCKAAKLICTIADNGIGIDSQKERNEKHKKSLATTITSERLKLLANDLKMEGSVTVEDRKKYQEQGTLVTLVIPHIKQA